MPIKNDDTLEFYVCHQEKAIMNIEEYHEKILKEYYLYKKFLKFNHNICF